MKTLWVALVAVLTPFQAFAYCSEPYGRVTFPDAPGSYAKPSVPYCLSSYSYSGTHTCEEWEISSYQNDVESYVSKLQAYADESLEAARKAARLAQEAQDYAKCQADEVSSQHK